jgi:hypothetical protein
MAKLGSSAGFCHVVKIFMRSTSSGDLALIGVSDRVRVGCWG